MIRIKDNTGSQVRSNVHKFTYNGTFMGESYITTDISSPTPIPFEIGDYTEYRGERFELNYVPAKTKQALPGSYGEAFVYKDVKLNSMSDELTRCDFLDYVSSDNRIHFSGLPNFSFYGTVKDLAERIQVNLDRIYTGKKKWTVSVDESFVSETKNISVSANNCWEALTKANSDFKANFIVRGRSVTIGTAGYAVGAIFGYGKGKGLYDIKQTTNQDSKIITRLRAYGSNKNIPSRYYQNQKKLDGTSYIPESMYVPNLVLPGFLENGGDAYIDSENISLYGVREGTVYFDGSGEQEEIYPSIQFVTKDYLAAAGITVSLPEGDNGNLNEVLSAENPEDNGDIPLEGEGELKGDFVLYLKDLGFNLAEKETTESGTQYKYAIVGEEMTITMNSGMCESRSFVITNVEQDTTLGYTRYKLTCNRNRDDNIGMAFPNSDWKIEPGDKFILTGISMPDVYIKAASEKLEESAIKYLSENDSTKYTYSPAIDNKFMADHPEISSAIKEGDILNFEDTDLGIDASIIISSLMIKEGDSIIPTYEITLNNEQDSSSIEKIQNAVSEIATNLSGLTLEQIKSQIASYGSRYFLSKANNDIASGTITFQKEQIFKEGIRDAAIVSSGTGWHIGYDPAGNSIMEIDKIDVRKTALFHEIVSEQISHVAGAEMLSLAAITVSSVEEIKSGTSVIAYKCFFDTAEGKLNNNFAAGDKAMCQVFSGTGTKYYWMQVISTGNDYITLSNTLKDPTLTGIPEIGDYIVQCGNRSDPDRQNVIILRSFGTPEIVQYKGVGKGNEFTFTGKDVSVISPAGNKFTGDFISKNTNKNIESEIIQTNENITLAVKEIEIGGRNLFLDSANRETVNNPKWYYQNSENPPFPFRITEMLGKNIVVSFDCEASNIPPYKGFSIGVQIFAFYTNGDGLACYASLPYSLFSNGYYKGRFSYVTYIPEGELKPIESANEFLATVNRLEGQAGLDGENPVSVKISNIKVEFGNKPTDWTPAPEDKAGTGQLKEAGIDIKAGTITLSASDKTKVEAILPDGSKTDVAVFEIQNGKPVLKADIISSEVIASVIRTDGLNVNENTIIDKDGKLISKNGIFENINAKSGTIGPFDISDKNLTAYYSEHEDPNDYDSPVIRTYHTALAGAGVSFLNMEALGMVSINAGVNLAGTGRTFLEINAEPDNMNPLTNGISMILKESFGFNGIYCKVEKTGGSGTAKGIVIETANPKDDIALEATGRVRLYNIRDIGNEDAVYNLQLYAQSAGNGNFYIMGKTV